MTQEPDQSYGPFQSRLRSNLEIIVDERIHAEKLTALMPWIVELFAFGDKDPETRCVVGSAFQEGFSLVQNLNAIMSKHDEDMGYIGKKYQRTAGVSAR